MQYVRRPRGQAWNESYVIRMNKTRRFKINLWGYITPNSYKLEIKDLKYRTVAVCLTPFFKHSFFNFPATQVFSCEKKNPVSLVLCSNLLCQRSPFFVSLFNLLPVQFDRLRLTRLGHQVGVSRISAFAPTASSVHSGKFLSDSVLPF